MARVLVEGPSRKISAMRKVFRNGLKFNDVPDSSSFDELEDLTASQSEETGDESGAEEDIQADKVEPKKKRGTKKKEGE